MDQPSADAIRTTRIVVPALLFGVITSAANHGSGPASEYTSKVMGNDWAWLVAIALAARAGDRWRTSLRAALLLVVPAVVAYYATDVAFGTYTSDTAGVMEAQPGPAGLDGVGAVMDTVAYLVIGTLAAAVLALRLVVMRRGGVTGLVALVALPLHIAHTAFSRADSVFPFDAVEQRAFHGVGVAAVAAAVIGAALHVRAGCRKPPTGTNVGGGPALRARRDSNP